MRTAALHNLGCKVNSYETEAMQQLLEEAGYEIVPFHEKADVYIINTCSVTNIADRKSRQMLHRAKKQNPDAVVVAAGCYVQAASEELKADLAVDVIIGNNKKQDLVPILEEYFQDRTDCDHVIEIGQTQEYERLSIHKIADHTRAFLKVQDGCNQFCSYCIIPYTRGRVRSRRPEEVVAEVKELAAAGYQEVVLTGIHLSSYGVDFDEEHKETLLSLIRQVHEVAGIKRIRLGSLEPRIITEEFAKALADMPKFCPHFHLSLQSGCDETLKRMNRHYTTEEYAEGCAILRRFFDNPAITTDVIVGFPGETEEEFAVTKAFLEQTGFYEMHIFKYSRRAGTRADRMPDQIPEQAKTARSEVLLKLEKQMSKAYRESFLGKKKAVLLEEKTEINGTEYMIGHTMEYVKAVVPYAENLKNKMVEGVLVRAINDEVLMLDESWKVV
ncbi:tRNA (N(6)-L-threonylcarbamoyladenosine(37)-C(2))-methylthiotransferase MtaB [Clostridium sp. AF32-12BH]|uniref:tRNA (N(6)-L-threonylcarbamoyladenosine(37)-C(2))- methylthiotransferase MtaB n=1 Tax=Clostridium sp. AF32-12BH TaxID=2292006 RepID=UPI000E4F74C5|nr:tRNA (N(6)-L-threonylcarbamoyladenosine(37)-C(2))-methylthiotransferase MtaB [Clostridium sp. AF32-12BH]RHP44644.1 tRNA (N(6)-L-threonylcarbamoyladenosine(37)-C(2))-methylthiotransferase MtaB [Clostridium sp. AF32-12BH]